METAWWRIKQFGSWIAAGVGLVVAWLVGFELIEKLITSQTAISIAANIYIVLFSATLIILASIRQWLTIRKERYANISVLLHNIAHQIRDLNTFIIAKEPRGGTESAYRDFSNQCKILFGRILDQLSTVFMSITSTHCRTSIKLLYGTDKLYVLTLSRDQGSRQKCFKMDNKRVENNHDPLEENLQFARLFDDNEDTWHFLSNDLTKDHNFRCTSVTAYKPGYATIAAGRKRSWPLPYKSTIACVIRQGTFDLLQDVKSEVLGFLTVDSESRNVFEERWDVEIMFAVADSLYTPLRAYLDAQNRASKGS
jgi:hypothetical protein